jgi:prepilin-type N-terminal cleavage/methylation domain-containing protein
MIEAPVPSVLARRAPAPQHGFTVLEVIIAVAILAIGIAAVMSVMRESPGVVSHTSTHAELTTVMDRAIERITAEVVNSGADRDLAGVGTEYVISHPATATTTLDYLELVRKLDIASDAWDEGNPVRIYLDTGAIGTLTDSNGSVSTKALVHEHMGRKTVLADGVTLVSFSRQNGVATIELTLELARYDRGAKRIIRRRIGPHHMMPGNF